MKENSKFNGNKTTTLAILVFAILLVIVVALIGFLVNGLKNDGESEEPEATPTATAQETPGQTEGTPELSPTQTVKPTDTPTPTATVPPTSRPTEEPRKPDEIPEFESLSKDGYAVIVDPKSINYSFLNGIPTTHFEDADEGVYDWYPGKATYNESTKTVTYAWDRYASTLKWLKKYDGVYRQNTNEKVIYLTFDCGYENGVTERILDVLKEKQCNGIFFVTGDYVDDKSTTSILHRMIDEGNLIGSHTDNHPIMPTLSSEKFVTELNGVYTKLKKIFGEDYKLAYYRPPQGASSPRDMALAYYLGYKSTFWAFAYGDYNPDNQPATDKALGLMKSSLHPGAVYLLHAVSTTNASVLGEFIDWVRAQGYEIRRIDK